MIPTLKVQMEDIVTARASHVGDRFVCKNNRTCNNQRTNIPMRSLVRGKVVEVIRPGFKDHGGIRLSFDKIEYNGCKSPLPKDILSCKQ